MPAELMRAGTLQRQRPHCRDRSTTTLSRSARLCRARFPRRAANPPRTKASAFGRVQQKLRAAEEGDRLALERHHSARVQELVRREELGANVERRFDAAFLRAEDLEAD